MSPPKSRPQMDASIIRRPGQAAPIQAPGYAQPVPDLVPAAPTPAVVAGLSPPTPATRLSRVEGKAPDNMPWLGGRPWTRKLGIRVDEDRVRRIKIVAAARGATMEELLVEAIDQYMELHWPEVSRGLR